MLFELKYFLFDWYTRIKVRLFPDPRPAAEILADVKQRLSEMPASKEIHEAYKLIEQAERPAGHGKDGR